MKVLIYSRDLLAVVGTFALISLSMDAFHFFWPRSGVAAKDVFDWQVVEERLNGNNTVVAVVSRGTPNTNTHTVPLYRLELKSKVDPGSWGNHWQVWESHVTAQPTIKWLGSNDLEIKHGSRLVMQYEPSVSLQGQEYRVHLNVLHAEP